MLHFEGGQLEFESKEDEYLIKMGASERNQRGIRSTFRLLPKITDLEINSTKKALDNVLFKKFFDGYLNYNVSNIVADISSKTSAVCSVPDDEVDDFTYQLERQGFYYEVD